MTKHIVLIGLPGSGKSTVGRLVAQALGARFVDVDREIERAAGVDIPTIFAEQGESAFRALEREHTARALEGPPAVIATGGGWPERPGAVEAARRRAVVLYLYIAPHHAARRTVQALDRPLLGADHEAELQALLDRRGRYYELADATVPADRTPREVADRVLTLARGEGGW